MAEQHSKFCDYAKGSIFTAVLCDSFTAFHEAHQRIDPKAGLLLKLPKIIVVGTNNVGKSSLLENITKCSIFPRDRNNCTKAPIRLMLKQVLTRQDRKCSIRHKGSTVEIPVASEVEQGDEILRAIEQIMQSTEGLMEDEIEVHIAEVRCSNKPVAASELSVVNSALQTLFV